MSSSIVFQHATEEYAHCIKTIVVTRCLAEYESVVYEADDHTVEEFRDTLLESIQDTAIWSQVFDKPTMRTFLNYYVALCSAEPIAHITPSIPVFHVNTFQEYIDAMVRFEVFGAADYQRFTNSMKEPAFRKSMIDKYNKDSLEGQVKNHIIYIVQLYLLERTGYSQHFTDTEREYLDVSINMIPLFEYIGRKNWTVEEIDRLEETANFDNMTDNRLYTLEVDTLRQIKNMFLR